MKRTFLFIITNLAVTLVLSLVLRLLGVDKFLTAHGLNVISLLIFSLVVGFAGAIISLLMSKTAAKISTGAQIITNPSNSLEKWLLDTVAQLSQRAHIQMPEVAIYQGAPNAFATGAFKNSALVAVSTGLLESMDQEEVEAVLAHEIAHVANGDMVTMTLIQGVVNTFVVFFSRIIAIFIDNLLSGNRERHQPGIGYTIASMVCQLVFGFLASIIVAWFSRQREFRADAGAAQYLGNPQPMIRALERLMSFRSGALPQGLQASGISGQGLSELFSTHPPLEKRIAALQRA